jgi:hypothetical protein
MDNKELAKLVRAEASRVVSGIAELSAKIGAMSSKIAGPWEKHETSVSPQQASTQENDAAHRQPAPHPEVPPSQENSAQPKKPWYKTAQGWKTALELIAIPFAIGYAVITWLQWKDLRHNFEADQRSWLKIEYAWPLEMDTFHPDWPASAKAAMWDVGKSAITLVKGEAVFEVLDAKSSPSLSLNNFHSTYVASPLFPSEETDFLIELFNQTTQLPRAFTQEEYDGLRNGTKYVAVFGYVTYKDQFGVHWYQFCSWKSYTTVRVQVNSGECIPFNKIGDGTTNLPFGRKYSE